MSSRYHFIVPVVALFCMLLPACWPSNKALQTKLSGVVLVNVLNKEFYADCHIKGSVHVELDQLEQWATESLDPDAEVIFYCSNYMCSTSEYAAKKLHTLGFKRVAVYEGGTAEWYQKGLPVKGPSKQAYLKVAVAQPEVHDGAIPCISAQELAQKMGIAHVQEPTYKTVAA